MKIFPWQLSPLSHKNIYYRLHLISSEGKTRNKHTLFVDSEKEKRELDLAARLDTHPALLDRTYNRPRLTHLKSGKFSANGVDAEQVQLLVRFCCHNFINRLL